MAIDESWVLFVEQYDQMMKLLRELGKRDWYVNGKYVAFVGHYHAGIYLQVYKAHWYNNTFDGIHFEIGLDADCLAAKTLRIDLHIGHRNLFDREKFNERTIERMAAVVEDWDIPHTFSKTNLSSRLSVEVPFTLTGFAGKVADGFEYLALLGPVIDDGLKGL